MFSKEFLKELFQRHNETHPFPSTSEIQKLFTKIVLSLFPEQTQKRVKSLEDLELYWD